MTVDAPNPDKPILRNMTIEDNLIEYKASSRAIYASNTDGISVCGIMGRSLSMTVEAVLM